MMIFNYEIAGYNSWNKIFNDINIWDNLVKYIFNKEHLVYTNIQLLIPGTNAVFRVGDYVIKIFAPEEANMGVGSDYSVEIFGIKHANKLLIPTPKLISYGVINDKYDFYYIITQFIDAKSLGDIEEELSYEDKIIIGKRLRVITDKMNVPCDNFTRIDIINNALNNDGWDDYPESFRKELKKYVSSVKIDKKYLVYCHGDINPDNILIDDNLNLYILDFADAMYAPIGYEHALIASELFCFEKSYMVGYFGEYTASNILSLCMKYLPLHDSGEHTIRANIGPATTITDFKVMEEKLLKLIKENLYL